MDKRRRVSDAAKISLSQNVSNSQINSSDHFENWEPKTKGRNRQLRNIKIDSSHAPN